MNVNEAILRGNVDELIDLRATLRAQKQWKPADDIRDFLETKYVFVFDAVWGQEVHHLNAAYFKRKDRFGETRSMSNRKYVEHRIAMELRADRVFNSWLTTMQKQKIN